VKENKRAKARKKVSFVAVEVIDCIRSMISKRRMMKKRTMRMKRKKRLVEQLQRDREGWFRVA